LQNAISASAAALSGRHAPRPSGSPGSQSKAAVPFIPTPDATGSAANWEKLYPVRNFVEPTTYIRFSETIEDVTGVAYTMDEDDEEWLEQYNQQAASEASKQKDTPSALADMSRSSRTSPKKDRPKDLSAGPLSEDEFEVIMDLFETQTEEKVPLLHLVSFRFVLWHHCLLWSRICLAYLLSPIWKRALIPLTTLDSFISRMLPSSSTVTGRNDE
jgi:enhancer of polycomb-like protein